MAPTTPQSQVIARRDHTVAACNIRSPRGGRCRKDRAVHTGESFALVEQFRSGGLATHGTPCVRLRTTDGYTFGACAEYYTITTAANPQ